MDNRQLNIHQRLHAVMQEVDYVQKEKKEKMQYSTVSHDAVTAKVRPALVKHGVIYYPQTLRRSQDGNRTECDIVVRFVNIDRPDDFIDVHSIGYGIDAQDKGPGKAMSYAVKYALLKALGLETGDDPDNENIEHKPAQKSVMSNQNELELKKLANEIKEEIKGTPPEYIDALLDRRRDDMNRIKLVSNTAYNALMAHIAEKTTEVLQ